MRTFSHVYAKGHESEGIATGGTRACPQPGIRRVRVNRWVVALAAVTIEVAAFAIWRVMTRRAAIALRT